VASAMTTDEIVHDTLGRQYQTPHGGIGRNRLRNTGLKQCAIVDLKAMLIPHAPYAGTGSSRHCRSSR